MQFLLYTKKIHLVVLLTLLFVVSGMSAALANGDFYDYLPKYRKYKSHYQIDKIHYQDKRTIVFFRFVVQKSGSYPLYGNDHPNSWYLRTPRRMRGVEIQFKQLEVKNIEVNGEVKLESLSKTPDISYELARGDVITYQVHFVRIPNYIRMLDMIEGKEGSEDPDKLNCFDILIKTKGNPLLGTVDNSKQVVSKFEENFTYIKPKKEQSVANNTTRAQPEFNPDKTKSNTATVANNSNNATSTTQEEAKADEPKIVDYMPKALESVDDFSCNRRVILPDVNFKENETSFSGRIKAIQNIRMIAEYMQQFPKSTANLFGHTDIFGSKYKNVNLSRERAFAVKRELVKQGIDSDRITVYFYGGEYPLAKYKNGGPANRRVEVEPVCND